MAEKKNTKKLLFILVILIGAVALGAKYFWFDHEFLYAGTLEATKIDLSAKLSSSIEAVLVHEGDHVTANQDLVRLSCEDIKVEAAWSVENYQRNLRLFRSGTASQEAMDQIKTKKDEMDVRQSWCSIRSPIQGTILSRYHEPGEWVVPGTKLLTLANIRDIWAYIYVPQPEVSGLSPGLKVKGILPELNHREFDGKIMKINDEAEFTPKNVQTRSERTRLVFGVKVSFQEANSDEVLKPGMTIEVRLPKE